VSDNKVSCKSKDYLLELERRFQQVSGIKEDLSVYPLHHSLDTLSVETNKSKSKEFGEVFTPLWLVDEMIKQVSTTKHSNTLDLCAGYGQFSIRLLRKLRTKNCKFDCMDFLQNKHSFSELQLSSCWKLVYIFSSNINLFIGDARELPSLPGVAQGIWVYLDSMKGWVPVTNTFKKLMRSDANGKKLRPIDEFVDQFQTVIDTLNKEYQVQYKINSDYSPSTRMCFLKAIIGDHNEEYPNDTHIHTPLKVVDDMLSCIDDLDKKQILVLFNAEIVEQLIHSKKIDPKNITFATDAQAHWRSMFVKAHYKGVETKVVSKDPKALVRALGTKKWDVVFSNPPYENLDLKIIFALMEAQIAKEYVIVHPTTWLLDMKGKNNLFTSFKNLLLEKVKSIKMFNGNIVFGISQFVPCSITHIDTNYANKNISVDSFGIKYQVDAISDITKFSTEWKTIVKSFFNKTETFVKAHGNVWNKRIKLIDSSKEAVQLGLIRGTPVREINNKNMYKDDFFTIVRRDSDLLKVISSKSKDVGPIYQFDSKIERDNFIEYLKTDYARFCLALLKNNSQLCRGELELIPWLDFTQAWDDTKLFAYFDINQETQDYIRAFLPDYYGIRKNQNDKAA
jgi:hypothetical protein